MIPKFKAYIKPMQMIAPVTAIDYEMEVVYCDLSQGTADPCEYGFDEVELITESEVTDDRLAAYEDTGLSPEEVGKLKYEYRQVCIGRFPFCDDICDDAGDPSVGMSAWSCPFFIHPDVDDKGVIIPATCRLEANQ